MSAARDLCGAALLLAAGALGSCGAEHTPGSLAGAGSARGFNLLLVTFDTVRADAIHCYGDLQARTPTVDRLAARGVRFAQALAPAPITLPSHATIMTGLEPPSHGVRNNGTFRLADEQVTLAERLRERGYATAAVVASFVLDQRYGLAQGFAHYDDELLRDGYSAGEGHYYQRNADDVTDGAIAWLAGQRETPFFLWVHYFDAHAPYLPPAAFAPASPDSTDPAAPYDPAATRARYLGEVAYADAALGRLLAAVGDERLRRTLVVFTADHGEGLGEHAEFTHSRLVYEGSMRVPLVLSCPSLFDREYVVDDRVVGLVDIAPTALALLGLETRACDGLNLFDARFDPDRAIYGESLVPQLNHGWAPLYSLRRLHDKFIRAPRPEYYDLRADPDEANNLFARSQPSAVALERSLAQRLEAAPHGERAVERELDPEEVRRLHQLGYTRSTPAVSEIGVLDPKDMIVTWAVLTNAQAHAGQGQFELALAEVESVMKLNPNDAFAWETAYVVHLKRNALDQAEQSIRRAIELNPQCDGYVRLGRLLQKREAYDEIEPLLSEASRLDPQNGEVMLLRGDLLVLQGRLDLAREQFERARLVDPVNASAGAKIGLDFIAAQTAKR